MRRPRRIVQRRLRAIALPRIDLTSYRYRDEPRSKWPETSIVPVVQCRNACVLAIPDVVTPTSMLRRRGVARLAGRAVLSI